MTSQRTDQAPVPQAQQIPGSTDVVYFDGCYLPKTEVRISPDDRGFLLGDGVYEVAAAYDGSFVALGRHMERLRHSLQQARIGAEVADPLESVFHELVERNGFSAAPRIMVYLQVTRGAALRTHAFPKTPVKPTVYAFAAPFPDMGDLPSGVAAITRPDLRWSRCDIKAISLIANCMANQEAKEAGAFEAILIRDGFALEGTHTSFFAVINGVVRTAPLSPLILPGITRQLVLDLAEKNGIEVREEAVRADALFAADELFITGTTTEVVPLVFLDGKPVGAGVPGQVTTRLAELYRNAVPHDV